MEVVYDLINGKKGDVLNNKLVGISEHLVMNA